MKFGRSRAVIDGGSEVKNRDFPARFLFILMVFILVGCSSGEVQETPEGDMLILEDFTPVVSATGKVIPFEWGKLSFLNSGVIQDVLVNEGDFVETNQEMVQLAGSGQLKAAVTAAELELLSAEKSLLDLYENAAMAKAQTEVDLAQAKIDLEDRIEERDKKEYRRVSDATLNGIRADYILAKDALEDAEEYFEAFSDRSEDDPERAQALSALSNAQKIRDRALYNLNYALGKPDAEEVAKAEALVLLAEARLSDTEKQYSKWENGPDPKQVEIAEARIENAKTQLDAANEILGQQALEAPFSGTVSEIYMRSDEWVMAGQPVLMLANLDRLQVETTDLSEIDVARIKLGDKADISFDAIPDIIAGGTVIKIAPKSDEGAGVNYRVLIELDTIPDGLRWGMTAFVDIEVGE